MMLGCVCKRRVLELLKMLELLKIRNETFRYCQSNIRAR